VAGQHQHRAVVLGLLLAVTSCSAGEARYPEVDGRPSDLHVAEGTYDGYRVVRRCTVGLRPNERDVAVVGTGGRCFEGVCGHIDEWTRGAQVFTESLREVIPTSSGEGYGARCTPGDHMSVHLFVRDWRSLDEVIRRVGSRLRSDGLGEEVVVSVWSGRAALY
jgi:hypothetical protein